MTRFFRLVSALFSPLIVPCYGIALALSVTALSVVPLSMRLGVVGVCALIIFVAPALAVIVLHRAGIVTDIGLNGRAERTWPYVTTMGCYLVAAYYLYSIAAPGWLIGIMAGGFLTIAVNLAVNFRWKISGHLAAMGGLCAVVFFLAVRNLAIINLTWVAIAAVLLTGLVATARLALERHTPLQVLAGWANGFICVFLSCMLFDRLIPSLI